MSQWTLMWWSETKRARKRARNWPEPREFYTGGRERRAEFRFRVWLGQSANYSRSLESLKNKKQKPIFLINLFLWQFASHGDHSTWPGSLAIAGHLPKVAKICWTGGFVLNGSEFFGGFKLFAMWTASVKSVHTPLIVHPTYAIPIATNRWPPYPWQEHAICLKKVRI